MTGDTQVDPPPRPDEPAGRPPSGSSESIDLDESIDATAPPPRSLPAPTVPSPTLPSTDAPSLESDVGVIAGRAMGRADGASHPEIVVDDCGEGYGIDIVTLDGRGTIASVGRLVVDAALVNVVPVVGLVLFGWPVFPVLALLWFEGVVVAVFALLQMRAVGRAHGGVRIADTGLLKWCAGVLFIGGILILAMTGEEVHSGTTTYLKPHFGPRPWMMLPGMLAILLRYGREYVFDFLPRAGSFDEDAIAGLSLRPFRYSLAVLVGLGIGGFAGPYGVLFVVLPLKVVLFDLDLVKMTYRPAVPVRRRRRRSG
jgi:hypothetical protein